MKAFVRTLTMYVGSSVARLLSSRYTKGTEQSIFWVTAISKEVCFVLFLAGFPELVRGVFSAPPVGHQSPRTIRLPSIQAATTVFSGGAPGAGAARLPLQPGRLPSGLMCAFVIACATHTLLDLATLSNQRPLCSMIAFDNHFRRGRQPVRLFGALVPRGVSVLFYSVRMAPDQYEPHSGLRANRLMPTLAADVQDYRDAIPCSSFTAGVLSAMRATNRELHWETPSYLSRSCYRARDYQRLPPTLIVSPLTHDYLFRNSTSSCGLTCIHQ